jgi:hypothetical protein
VLHEPPAPRQRAPPEEVHGEVAALAVRDEDGRPAPVCHARALHERHEPPPEPRELSVGLPLRGRRVPEVVRGAEEGLAVAVPRSLQRLNQLPHAEVPALQLSLLAHEVAI